MPSGIASPCRASLCPHLAGPKGYCPEHQQPYDAERRQQRRVYRSPLHQQWRKVILYRDRICQHCRKAPATMADHIRALKNGGDWSYQNGEGLCRVCHGRKTVQQDGALSRA